MFKFFILNKSITSAQPWKIFRVGLLCLGFVILFLPFGSSLAQDKDKKEEEEEYIERVFFTKKQALKHAFPGVKKFKKKKIWLTPTQREAIGKITGDKYKERRITFFEGLKNDQTQGYVTIGNEIGRSYPITFMVVITPEGAVKDVEIMVYREPHGWEVQFEYFMKQFFGRDASNPFNDINNITGATLSVRSMTRGVKKAVAAYKVLFLDKVE